jgi:hypothetical protein
MAIRIVLADDDYLFVKASALLELQSDLETVAVCGDPRLASGRSRERGARRRGDRHPHA